MSPGRRTLVAITLGSTLALAGCAQQGPFAQRKTTLASLKSSVALLENQNAQLKSKVADLSTDNRRLEDRLVQEESANGDLAARLDDARNLISQRGDKSNSFNSFDDEPVTRPVARPTKRPRRPPAASISSPDDDSTFQTDPIDLPKPRTRYDGAQSSREESTWLPIAQGVSEPKYRLK